MLHSRDHLKPTTDSAGFTIIEVLIVLAIAGVIMLIVFEAIPALTRASRNNARKQDAAAILQEISRYELSNSDNFPNGCGAGFASVCQTASTSSPLHYITLSYYDPTTDEVTIDPQTEATAAQTISAATNTNDITIYNYELCVDGVQDTATNVGADYNDVVAIYALENGSGGATGQCSQL